MTTVSETGVFSSRSYCIWLSVKIMEPSLFHWVCFSDAECPHVWICVANQELSTSWWLRHCGWPILGWNCREPNSRLGLVQTMAAVHEFDTQTTLGSLVSCLLKVIICLSNLSTLVEEWPIVMSMSVCVRVCMSVNELSPNLYQFFARCLWLWLSSSNFQFYARNMWRKKAYTQIDSAGFDAVAWAAGRASGL